MAPLKTGNTQQKGKTELIKSMWQRKAGIALSILFFIAGCGGGGGGSATAPAQTVSGVAAAGAVITGTVSIEDSAAALHTLSKTTTDGSFSFDLPTTWTKPFMLRVVGNTAGGTPYTLYSLAADAGTANINPMSNLVLANAAVAAGAGANLDNIYAAPGASLQAISNNVAQSLLGVQAVLKPQLTAAGVAAVNPITAAYSANHTGLDAVFDAAKISVDATSGAATVTPTTGTALSYPLGSGFATFTVSGKALLAGAGLAGVTVTVADTATGTVYGSPQTATDGSYALSGVPQGSFTVTPSLAGYLFDQANSTLSVTGASSVPDFLASVAPQPQAVSGRVTSGNQAGLAGVTVTAKRVGSVFSVTGVTDGVGNYSISGLNNGDYVITVARDNIYTAAAVAFTPASRTVTINSDHAFADFAADAATFKLSGNVTNIGAVAPLASVKITLTAKLTSQSLATYTGPVTSAELSFSAFSDAAGNYAISGIPNGFYTLTPTLAGSIFSESPVLLVNGADKGVDFTALAPNSGGGGVIIQF